MIESKKNKTQWYSRYLPFIAQPQHLQVEWLAAECKKQKLTSEELLPYVRLLFTTDSDGERRRLKVLLSQLGHDVIYALIDAADIYIVARIIDLIPELTPLLTELVLLKEMPPYEQKPQKIMDEIFYSINLCDGDLLERVATQLMAEEKAPEGFRANYGRFRAILADEEFIRTHWPSAK